MEHLFSNNDNDDFLIDMNNLIDIVMGYINTTYNAACTIRFRNVYMDDLSISETEDLYPMLTINFFVFDTIIKCDMSILDILDTFERYGIDVVIDEVTHYIDSEILYIAKKIFFKN